MVEHHSHLRAGSNQEHFNMDLITLLEFSLQVLHRHAHSANVNSDLFRSKQRCFLGLGTLGAEPRSIWGGFGDPTCKNALCFELYGAQEKAFVAEAPGAQAQTPLGLRVDS